MADDTKIVHWESKECGPIMTVDGFRHILTIPPVNNQEVAQTTEDFINHYGMADRITQMSRSAHVPGSAAPKLLRNYLMLRFSIIIDTEESITNLFMFMKKRNEMWRTLMAAESKDSGFDKVIDSTLLMAFEDISIEYARSSSELRELNDENDPDLAKVATLTKKTGQLRKEMLRFKELVRPAEQKVDVDDKRAVERESNNVLNEALARLNIGPATKGAIASAT